MRVLITGGTGSLGRALIARLLAEGAERVAVFSRDEAKQQEVVEQFNDHPALRMRLGDVRDRHRLELALHPTEEFDAVIHAAALKRVDQIANDPEEAKKTNIDGTINVCNTAMRARIPKVMVISSDKAVNPTNMYGCTKLQAEMLAVHYNSYTPGSGTRIGAVRYGNVWGSRGSVPLVWKQMIREQRPLMVTDPAMTRFLITMPEAVEFVLSSLELLEGGEVFVPSLPAFRLCDLLDVAVASQYKEDSAGQYPVKITGLRPGGEKLHELLLSSEEVHRTNWIGDRYIVKPWLTRTSEWPGTPIEPFDYRSDTAPPGWITIEQLQHLWDEIP